MSKAILVTGATGKQGGAVVNALLSQKSDKFTILAVTRNPGSPAALALTSKSPLVRLVQGNLDDPAALFAEARRVTAQPIWGVFSVQVSLGRGVTTEGEVAQGVGLIDEAVRQGVRCFVYSSVERGGDEASWNHRTPVGHFQTKYRIERHLREATGPGRPGMKMAWTVLRPVAFMCNLAPDFPTRVFLAAMRNWLDPAKKVQWVAVSDIGVFAAKAFADPDRWSHRAVGLAGDELTFDQLSQTFERVTGQPAPVTYWFFGSALTSMVAEVRLMLGWFASDGYAADIEARRAEHPEMLTMEKWLVEQSPFKAKSSA
ncbi:NAD(P)-binding protein [Xylariaceae sp. FL0804]|nr:NAD(P)-binding protein [Xylariaceae sp. FL0804]